MSLHAFIYKHGSTNALTCIDFSWFCVNLKHQRFTDSPEWDPHQWFFMCLSTGCFVYSLCPYILYNFGLSQVKDDTSWLFLWSWLLNGGHICNDLYRIAQSVAGIKCCVIVIGEVSACRLSNLFYADHMCRVTLCGQIRDCRLCISLLNFIMTVLSQICTQILIKPLKSEPVTVACLFFSALNHPTVLGTLIETDFI